MLLLSANSIKSMTRRTNQISADPSIAGTEVAKEVSDMVLADRRRYKRKKGKEKVAAIFV